VIFLVMNTDSKPESFANPAVEKDHGIAQFAGCLPDFPEREPQGEFEVREPLI
jgi:hypothetical protein